ncbi:MAG: metal ABC transporter permease [bacterium JZ-2024 1]
MELWDLLFRGLLVCLVLVGIHTYFGLFILERGIVFADLALAQMAGFGVALATTLGYPPPSPAFFAIVGATNAFSAILVAHAARLRKVSYAEGTIGLIYIGAVALTLLLLSHSPHGVEQIRDLFSGEILWVSYPALFQTALLYASVALAHLLLWNHIRLVLTQNASFLIETAFLFTFAIVVTSSVKLGGVLLVFAYLVGTSLISFLLAKTFFARLVTGWFIGALASLTGIVFAFLWDIPVAPVIVGLICFAYCLALLSQKVVPRRSP